MRIICTGYRNKIEQISENHSKTAINISNRLQKKPNEEATTKYKKGVPDLQSHSHTTLKRTEEAQKIQSEDLTIGIEGEENKRNQSSQKS